MKNLTSLISVIDSVPAGTFVKAAWMKTLKTKKDVTANVVKVTSGVFRIGIDYDKVADVQEGRANGTLPEKNAGLPWGQWHSFPRIIEHKEAFYVRMYFAKGNESKLDRISSVYILNGKEIGKDELQAMGICLASEFPKEKPDEELNTFTVKAENFIQFADWKA
jgi:hypothetical protein